MKKKEELKIKCSNLSSETHGNIDSIKNLINSLLWDSLTSSWKNNFLKYFMCSYYFLGMPQEWQVSKFFLIKTLSIETFSSKINGKWVLIYLWKNPTIFTKANKSPKGFWEYNFLIIKFDCCQNILIILMLKELNFIILLLLNV